MKHVDGNFHFPLMPTTSKQTQFNINIKFHTRFGLPTQTHTHEHTNAHAQCPRPLTWRIVYGARSAVYVELSLTENAAKTKIRHPLLFHPIIHRIYTVEEGISWGEHRKYTKMRKRERKGKDGKRSFHVCGLKCCFPQGLSLWLFLKSSKADLTPCCPRKTNCC